MLKSHLDKAILLYQTEIFMKGLSQESTFEVARIIDALIQSNQEVNLETKTWQDDYEKVIEKLQRQAHNQTLRRCYDYGSTIHHADLEPHWSKRQQIASSFIFQYFEDVPEAILLLEEVSLGQIQKLNKEERQALLEPRVAASGRSVDQRPDNFEADDLWTQDVTSAQNEVSVGVLLTEEPSPKRSRHSPQPLQPPQPLSAAELDAIFTCDFDLPPDLTIPLDPDMESIDRGLKRKFE